MDAVSKILYRMKIMQKINERFNLLRIVTYVRPRSLSCANFARPWWNVRVLASFRRTRGRAQVLKNKVAARDPVPVSAATAIYRFA